jgi:hypothetical protein
MEYFIADDLSNIPANKDIWNTLSLTIYQNTPIQDIWYNANLQKKWSVVRLSI